MAIHACAECQRDVSDKAIACPHCGLPLQPAPAPAAQRAMVPRVAGGVLLLAVAAASLAFLLRGPDYSRVEQLRAEQDADGTHDQNVRQRFYRLYKAHPESAMYIYLWSRCVDDAAEQLKLAEEGIHADPRFSWNYNMASRALARLNRVPEAYDLAVKGVALDPGNMQLAEKQRSLKLILDHKLADESRPSASDKGSLRYQGLFKSVIRAPEHSDIQAVETSRLADYKSPAADAVHGFVVCANPFADSCVRAYVPRDGRLKGTWPPPDIDVTTTKEHQLVTVVGAPVTNSKGETILLADSVTVGAL